MNAKLTAAPAGRPDLRARPRLRAGTCVAAAPDGVTFISTARSREVRGEDALAVLLPVVRLLDGTRSIEQVAGETGIEDGTVRAVCDFLRANDLLRDEEPAGARGRLRSFLADQLEAPYTDALLGPLLDRVESAVVLVVAPSVLARRIAADLAACDVGDARVCDRGFDEDALPASVAVPAFAVVLRDPRDPEAADRAVRTLCERGATVLTLAVDDGVFELGPSFAPGQGCCHRCFRTASAERFGAGPGAGQHSTGADWEESLDRRLDLVAGFACQEVLLLAAGYASPATPGAVVRYALPTLETVRLLVAAEPGCPECGDSPVPAVNAFEESVRLRSPAPPAPSSVEQRHAATVMKLLDQRPPYPFHPRATLPRPTGAPAPLPAGLSPAAVARLLNMTAGRRHDEARGERARWAASGGNLGSAELFAVFDGAFLGWPPRTIFRYDDLTHELIVVRRKPAESAGLTARGDRAATPGEMRLILVANVRRLVTKYMEFGLRLAFLDAGCALAQLSCVSALLGLDVEVCETWSPELRTELELHEGSELITASVRLTATTGERRPRHAAAD